MQHYSHLATATNILWQLIEANDHNPVALYQDVGIDPDILNKPGARIPSHLLGFSDQSAFSRAFKRWTGNPPSEVRRSG